MAAATSGAKYFAICTRPRLSTPPSLPLRLSTLFSGNASSVVAARGAREGRRTDERSFGLDAERRAAAAAVTDGGTGRYTLCPSALTYHISRPRRRHTTPFRPLLPPADMGTVSRR